TNFRMLLFQPARLADSLEILLGMLEEPLKRLALVLEIRPVALNEEIEINLMGIELRTVHAGELRSFRREDAAAAAHAGAVDHHRIQADHCLDPMGTSSLGHCLHHPGRTYGQHKVELATLVDQSPELVGHKTFALVTTVVGCNQQLVADR